MSDKMWRGLWWVTMKLVKLHVYALAALAYLALATTILLYARQYINRHETWMRFETPLLQGKIFIPEEITKTKDCEQFLKWEYNNIPLVMHGTCPWYEYTPIYEVKIGELELKIPRKHLLLPSVTERHTDSLSTKSFIYPSMELEGRKSSPDSFWFTLETRITDEKNKTAIQRFFWNFLRTLYPAESNYKFIPLGFDESTGMRRYKFIRFSKTNQGIEYTVESFVHTNDDINDPKDFVVCGSDSESSSCDSVFLYKGVHIHYRFEKHLLNKPKDIKSAVIKLIQEWEAN